MKTIPNCAARAEGISHSEEQALFKTYRAGGTGGDDAGDHPDDASFLNAKSAQARIVEAYQPLVRAMARKLYLLNKDHTQKDDLISAGNEGLLRALLTFEPDRGLRFGTYARWWVHNGMAKQIRFDRWPIRIPDHIYKLVLKLMKAERQLFQELLRRPTNAELAERLDKTVRQIARVRTWISSDLLSLDMPVGEMGDATLGDFVEGYARQPEEIVLLSVMKRDVAQVLQTLTPRQEKMIRLRFGMESSEPTLEEVGQSFAVTRERVRQIEAQALRRLHHPTRARLLMEWAHFPAA
jgi:RNA polymerase primary sigma factor